MADGGREEKFRREDRGQKGEEAKQQIQTIQIQKSTQHQPASTSINPPNQSKSIHFFSLSTAATSSWVVQK
jgi:hypothetical protein